MQYAIKIMGAFFFFSFYYVYDFEVFIKIMEEFIQLLKLLLIYHQRLLHLQQPPEGIIYLVDVYYLVIIQLKAYF